MTEARHIPPPYTPPPAEALKVLYFDDAIVVVNKPSGLLSVPGIGPEKAFCAQSIVSDRFGEALIVHRLDMDTSGIMVLARTKVAQRNISKLFEQRRTSKTYTALVEGLVRPDGGTIDKAIAKYSLNRPLRHLDDEGQDAITDWQVVERDTDANHTRLDLHPKTGRSHQLRLHLKSIGHPILGDAFYGDPSNAPRLYLHASRLIFEHPVTLAEIDIKSPAPF